MKKSKANPLDAVVPFPWLPRKRQSFHKENSAIDEGLLHLWGSLLDFSAASDLVSENVTCRSRKIYCWNDLHLMNYTQVFRARGFKSLVHKVENTHLIGFRYVSKQSKLAEFIHEALRTVGTIDEIVLT